jgi:hypothetical protein
LPHRSRRRDGCRRREAFVRPMPSLRACGARPSGGMGYPGSDGLGGETRDGAQVVFSEGRTPCVRVARPHECRGIPFAADGLTMSRWPGGGDVGVGVMPSLRACGARPSRGVSRGEMAFRWKARGWRERRFSRRGAVSAPAEYSRADAKAFHFRRSVDDEPVAKRAHASVKPMAPLRACGARPSAKPGPLQGEPAAPKAKGLGNARCLHCARA